MAAGKKVSFPPWMVGLFVFGGRDPETGIQGYIDSFNFAFSCEKCLQAWELVGAVPPTHACLKDLKVRRELGDVTHNTGGCNANCHERDAGGKYKFL